jgi:hypothetical protein
VFTGHDAAGRPANDPHLQVHPQRQAQSALAKFVSDVESGQAPLTRDTITLAKLLCHRARSPDNGVKLCARRREGADIVWTLTPSPTPVVKGEWSRPGLQLNAVGSPPRADYGEIDTQGVRRSRVVDSVKVVSHKSGDVLVSLAEEAIDTAHFREELGQLVTHERPGRAGDHQITLYKSVGLAVQDIACARLVVAAARQKDWGPTSPFPVELLTEPIV